MPVRIPSRPPEDEHGPSHARRLPARRGFQIRQHLIEAISQVGEHMVPVQARAVSAVERRRGASHENRGGEQTLQVPLGGEQPFPVGQRGGGVRHARTITPRLGKGYAA